MLDLIVDVSEIVLFIVAVWGLSARARQREVDRTPFVVGALVGWSVIWAVDHAAMLGRLQRWMVHGSAAGPMDHGHSTMLRVARWALVAALFIAIEITRPSRLVQSWECPECGERNDPAALSCVCGRLRPDVRT